MARIVTDMWYVYILLCADDTLYTGSTNNLEARVARHNGTTGGAKYTRSRKPVRVVYVERKRTRSRALSREAMIKKLTRAEKLALVAQKP